jgi:hypothetical protein
VALATMARKKGAFSGKTRAHVTWLSVARPFGGGVGGGGDWSPKLWFRGCVGQWRWRCDRQACDRSQTRDLWRNVLSDNVSRDRWIGCVSDGGKGSAPCGVG